MSYTAPSYFSPSSLSTWEQCPKRFYYEKIEGRRSASTEPQMRGNFVHEVLEELLTLEPGYRTLDNAKALTRGLWDSTWSEKVSILHMSDKDLHAFRWTSWWCVENYFKIEDPREIEPLGLEVKVEGRIDGVPIFGIVDRWTATPSGKIVISDYKTGKVPKSQYSAEKKLQIMIYADLIEQQTGREASKMELLYVKDGKKVTYKPTKELRQRTSDTLVTAWDAMSVACETEVFPTQTGPLCNWCDFKPECPAFQ